LNVKCYFAEIKINSLSSKIPAMLPSSKAVRQTQGRVVESRWGVPWVIIKNVVKFLKIVAHISG
jgi:hypothetical protein